MGVVPCRQRDLLSQIRPHWHVSKRRGNLSYYYWHHCFCLDQLGLLYLPHHYQSRTHVCGRRVTHRPQLQREEGGSGGPRACIMNSNPFNVICWLSYLLT